MSRNAGFLVGKGEKLKGGRTPKGKWWGCVKRKKGRGSLGPGLVGFGGIGDNAKGFGGGGRGMRWPNPQLLKGGLRILDVGVTW